MRTEKHSGVFLLKKGEFKACMGSMGRVSGADEQTSDSVDGGDTFPALPCCFQGPSVLS